MRRLFKKGRRRNLSYMLAFIWPGLMILLTACHSPVSTTSAPFLITRDPALVTPPPTSPVTRELNTPVNQAGVETDVGRALTQASPTATSAVPRLTLGVGAGVPIGLQAAFAEFARVNSDLFAWQGDGQADLVLQPGSDLVFAQWVYALVAPFVTIEDELDSQQIRQLWQAGQLLISTDTALSWQPVWGDAGSSTVWLEDSESASQLWGARTGATTPYAILPFEQLEPALKVLRVDGVSPLQIELNNNAGLLRLDFTIVGEADALARLQGRWQKTLSNRETGRMTRVAMTGVTALTRATAFQMEINGVDYPGQEVAAVLRGADIAHVSHEVSFSASCPYPDPLGGTSFCARESYLDLLVGLGIDVVELTGNHVNDVGRDALVYTIGLYEQAGMRTFGGGVNAELAAQPAIFEHHGNRIAFIGCNPAGPNYAWATATAAGSSRCDYAALYERIAALRDSGHVVIATLQYQEHYDYLPIANQRRDFRALIDAGAQAVSGSQGHHAMAFDLYAGGFIHYGPGNLFFDQMQMIGTRESFVDTYVVYDGDLISVELWTGLIENFARPRLMTSAERAATLSRVFAGTQYER